MFPTISADLYSKEKNPAMQDPQFQSQFPGDSKWKLVVVFVNSLNSVDRKWEFLPALVHKLDQHNPDSQE